MCVCTRNHGTITGYCHCPFRFTITKDRKTGKYEFSTASKRTCLEHNHNLQVNIAKVITDEQRNRLQQLKSLKGSNNQLLIDAFLKETGQHLSHQELHQIC